MSKGWLIFCFFVNMIVLAWIRAFYKPESLTEGIVFLVISSLAFMFAGTTIASRINDIDDANRYNIIDDHFNDYHSE